MQRGYILKKSKWTRMGCICIQQQGCHPSDQYKWIVRITVKEGKAVGQRTWWNDEGNMACMWPKKKFWHDKKKKKIKFNLIATIKCDNES